MTFVLATGQLTWRVSSCSGLEYVYYHKLQHPIEHQYQLEVIYIINLLLSIGKIFVSITSNMIHIVKKKNFIYL